MLDGVKILVLTEEGNIKTFNANNRWAVIGTQDQLNPTLFANSGTTYDIINATYSTIKLDYTLVQTFDDGTKEYESEELSADMGITNITSEYDASGNEKIVLTVPSFVPANLLLPTDKLLYYNSDTTWKPYIFGLNFTPSTTHNQGVTFNANYGYNYNENVKFRFKINGGDFTAWSKLVPSGTLMSGSIVPSSLMVGTNGVTIEISNENNSKVTSFTVASAITLTDTAPGILFITADSDEFKLHFSLNDTESDDISYRILLNNTRYVDLVLRDWGDFKHTPYEDIIYFNTAQIDVNKDNKIRIECKDKFGIITKSEYVFKGKYKNLTFKDQSLEYLSTDRGVVLKKVDFPSMVAGSQSDIRTITVTNETNTVMKNLKIYVSYINQVPYMKTLLSKNLNPFIGSEQIIYEGINLAPGATLDFYVRIDTEIKCQGISDFDIIIDNII